MRNAIYDCIEKVGVHELRMNFSISLVIHISAEAVLSTQSCRESFPIFVTLTTTNNRDLKPGISGLDIISLSLHSTPFTIVILGVSPW